MVTGDGEEASQWAVSWKAEEPAVPQPSLPPGAAPSEKGQSQALSPSTRPVPTLSHHILARP